MKEIIIRTVIFSTISLFSAQFARAEAWNLPAQIDSSNAALTFSLDTTWHTVHGTTHALTGKVWLANPADAHSVQLEGSLPVSSMDTGSESRDEEMRDSMNIGTYADVQFKLRTLQNSCDPQTITPDKPCAIEGLTDVTINGVTKSVPLKGSIKLEPDQSFFIATDSRLSWKDFGVRDPSILIARVHPDVDVHLEIHLNKKQQA